MIEDDTIWVVDTGMPNTEALRITSAPLVSAAKPLIGCSLTILWPSVLMMRQPPPAVPAAMVSAETTFTHTGITKPPAGFSSMRRKPSIHGRWSN